MRLRDLTEEELLELFREYDGVILKSYINGRFNYRSRAASSEKIVNSLIEQGLIIKGNQTLYGNTRSYLSLTDLGRAKMGMGERKELSLGDKLISYVFTIGEHINLTDLDEFFKSESITLEQCRSAIESLIRDKLMWGFPKENPDRFRLTTEGKQHVFRLVIPSPTSLPKKSKKTIKDWTIKDEIREGKRAWRSIRLLARAPIPIVPRPPISLNNRSYPDRAWKDWAWPGGPN